MAKFKLTEDQLDRVKKTVLTEQNDNTYSREIELSFGVNHEQRFNGSEIEEITAYSNKIKLSYVIEMDVRSWGVKDISLYNIKGPEYVDAEVTFYPEGSDDPITKEITVPLDWENYLSTNEIDGKGIITIGDELQVTVYFGEGGNISSEMELDIYTL